MSVLGKVNGVFHIRGFQHGITGGFQQTARKFAKGSFVFHEKDGLISSRKVGTAGRRARSLGNSADAGKIDFEGGAATGLAVGHDVATTLFNNSIDRRKPEPCAFPYFFGSEK